MNNRSCGSPSCLAALLSPSTLSIFYFSETFKICESARSGVGLGVPRGQPALSSSAEFPVQAASPASCTSLWVLVSRWAVLGAGLQVKEWVSGGLAIIQLGETRFVERRCSPKAGPRLPQDAQGAGRACSHQKRTQGQKEVRNDFIGLLAAKF